MDEPLLELPDLPDGEAGESEGEAAYSGEEPISGDEDDHEDDDDEDGEAAEPKELEEERVGDEKHDDDDSANNSNPPENVDPYETLGLENSATQSQVRSAYHKLALKHHPDKVPTEKREEADIKFKEIAFAYAILSDEKKRKSYDSTGRTDGEGGDFDWSEFMANQYKVVINAEVIEKVKKEYVGTDEEREDVIKAYKKGKGSWQTIFDEVMMSVMLNPGDEKRFRGYIDAAIKSGAVKKFKAYDESSGDKAKRLNKAEKEAKEAEKVLKKMGVKKDPSKMTEEELGQLIRSRKPTISKLDDDGAEALAKHYEDKYGTPKKKKERKRKSTSEPTEEEFQATQRRMKKSSSG